MWWSSSWANFEGPWRASGVATSSFRSRGNWDQTTQKVPLVRIPPFRGDNGNCLVISPQWLPLSLALLVSSPVNGPAAAPAAEAWCVTCHRLAFSAELERTQAAGTLYMPLTWFSSAFDEGALFAWPYAGWGDRWSSRVPVPWEAGTHCVLAVCTGQRQTFCDWGGAGQQLPGGSCWWGGFWGGLVSSGDLGSGRKQPLDSFHPGEEVGLASEQKEEEDRSCSGSHSPETGVALFLSSFSTAVSFGAHLT